MKVIHRAFSFPLVGTFPIAPRKDSFRDVVRQEILDPESWTRRFVAALAPFAPVLPAFLGVFSEGVLAFSPPVIGMTSTGSGGKKGILPEEEFEKMWIDHLRTFPKLATVDEVGEIVSRVERKVEKGESVALLWLTLSEIAASAVDQEVRRISQEASRRLQTLYEKSLELLNTPRPSGKTRDLKRGLRNALEKREYDRAVDFIVALLRKDKGKINYWILNYPHPMVRSFIYSFLVSRGHVDKICGYWEEFESILFPQDIETDDREIKRLTVGILGPMIAAGGEEVWRLAIRLFSALKTGEVSLIERVAMEITASPEGKEGTPLSYLLFCATDPADADLRLFAQATLWGVVRQLEVRED